MRSECLQYNVIDATLRKNVGTPLLAVMLSRTAMRSLQLTSPDSLSASLALELTLPVAIALLPSRELARWRPPRRACIAGQTWPAARVR